MSRFDRFMERHPVLTVLAFSALVLFVMALCGGIEAGTIWR